MSILIKGMEMPENCGVCRFAGSCRVLNVEEWPDLESIVFNDVIGIDGVRDPGCPLIPVPPHGRLIDADELFKEMERKGWFDNADRDKAEDLVLAAPTIIPASFENLPKSKDSQKIEEGE